MADGEIVFEATISDKKLHQELNKVKSNIESLQKEFNRLGAQKTPMEDRLRNIGAELDAAKQVLADMRTAPKGTYEKSTCPSRPSACECCKANSTKLQIALTSSTKSSTKPAIRFPTRKRRRLNYHDKSMDDPKVLDCATQPKRRQIP